MEQNILGVFLKKTSKTAEAINEILTINLSCKYEFYSHEGHVYDES